MPVTFVALQELLSSLLMPALERSVANGSQHLILDPGRRIDATSSALTAP
jgi:hypothetical protein